MSGNSSKRDAGERQVENAIRPDSPNGSTDHIDLGATGDIHQYEFALFSSRSVGKTVEHHLERLSEMLTGWEATINTGRA
ncbi:MAG: hypothetical protein M1818_001149 [Claussenomyces sp. TS43310]|nr:MAG: hypothetical protein M1818_001149 [Claussenomyces sp. TS43310]